MGEERQDGAASEASKPSSSSPNLAQELKSESTSNKSGETPLPDSSSKSVKKKTKNKEEGKGDLKPTKEKDEKQDGEKKKVKKKSKKSQGDKKGEGSSDVATDKEDKEGSPSAAPLTIAIPESPTNKAGSTKAVETPRPWETESYVSLEKHRDGRQLRYKRILLQTELGEIGTLLKVGAESPTGQSVNPQHIFNPDDESIIDFDQYRFGYTGTTNPEGQPHGKGKMLWKDDSSYEGDWINGQRHGFGVQKWASGDRYEGQWMQDKQKGEGLMYYASDYGPDKFYTAFEYLPSKPTSVASGYDRYESLGVAPIDAVEADGDSTTGALSHRDILPEGDLRSVHEGGSEERHRQRFPADRPKEQGQGQGQGNNNEDDDLASLGMESVGGGGAGPLVLAPGPGAVVVAGPGAVPAGSDMVSVDGTAASTADLGHLYREDSVYDGSRVREQQSSHRCYRRDPETWDLQHSEGFRYVGERNSAGQREGRGKFRFRDGSFYDGEWRSDKMHGVGWLTQPRMGAAFVIKKSDGRVLPPSPSAGAGAGAGAHSPTGAGAGLGLGSLTEAGSGSRRESNTRSPSFTIGGGGGGGGDDDDAFMSTGTDTGTGTDPMAESTRGQPTQQPPSSPSAKVDRNNRTSDRRADSPPGRARDAGITYNQSRTLALQREEEEEQRKRAAAGSITPGTGKGRKESQASPFQGMSPAERSAARRESGALSRRQSASPGAGATLLSPGGIASLASPSAFSEALDEGDAKVVLRDDYKGDFCEDKKHGSGRMRYADGSVYYGEWQRDKRHGYGEYYYANGDKYCGHWEDDLMHTPLIAKEMDPDQGLYLWANGDRYKGGFAKGQKYGEGRKDYAADGSIEQGHWEYDSFEGYPFSPDLDYEGEYNMTRGSYMYGKKQGFGRKVWKDGTRRIYDGQWDCDRMHGQAGKMINFFGFNSVYEGQLVADGVPHGNGKMRYPNGDEYTGQWERGKRHGKGEYRTKDGQVRTGEWFQGRGMFRMSGVRFY